MNGTEIEKDFQPPMRVHVGPIRTVYTRMYEYIQYIGLTCEDQIGTVIPLLPKGSCGLYILD